MTKDVYWKLRRLWTRGWEEGGREMRDAGITAVEGPEFKSEIAKEC